MSGGARNAANNGGGGDAIIAAIIAAAVDAFLREESAESAADSGTKISAWRMAARTATAGIGGARGYGAGGGWRGIG